MGIGIMANFGADFRISKARVDEDPIMWLSENYSSSVDIESFELEKTGD